MKSVRSPHRLISLNVALPAMIASFAFGVAVRWCSRKQDAALYSRREMQARALRLAFKAPSRR
jgi:hypothetical protein